MDGNLFKTIRKTLGYTQIEMSERLGVSRQLITAIEAGNRKVQPYLVTKLYLEFDPEIIERIRRINESYV